MMPWARAVVHELAAAGVRDAWVCPGSRSGPLALALEAHEDITVRVLLDERGAGYAAIGQARVTGLPSVVLTTSGTAAANLLPAAAEADNAGVPLLLLTADRPRELRDVGANQAIRQAALLGNHVRYHIDLPEPDRALAGFLRQSIARAVAEAAHGPVHVNIPLRQPLYEEGDDLPGRLGPWLQVPGLHTATRVPELAGRGLIVVGPLPPLAPAQAAARTQAILRLSARTGAPILSDVQSGVPGLRALADARPDWVVRFGGIPTWQRLHAAMQDWAVLVVDERPEDHHHAESWLRGDITATAQALHELARQEDDPAWTAVWQEAHQAEMERPMTPEEAACAVVRDAAPDDALIVAASSRTVRACDRVRLPVIANRGASGIDGTIHTAIGVAAAGGPVLCLVGDQAFLHDVNALAALPPGLRLVVLDNGGGQIFRDIDHPEGPAFERLYVNPHGLDLAAVAEGFGHASTRVEPSGLAAAIAGDARILVVQLPA